MSSPEGLRQRAGKEAKKAKQAVDDLAEEVRKNPALQKPVNKSQESQVQHWIAFSLLTALAFLTRFWGISHPDQVVFDEVHFGKFAAHYINRTYFFDVHPPFGKLLFAAVGWLVGFDGSFLFENIGDDYISNNVPYVAFRALPAILGALTVSTVYLIMWESDYTVPACVIATAFVLFDNAHIGQTRLILLDATLVFFMAASVLAYVRFYKLRFEPFSRKWWKWLLLTGIFMSCVISTKYVGAFTFFSIGCAVIIDLWSLLDVNRKHGALTLIDFGKHFFARLTGLVVVPFFFYLFWFQVHFAILTRSGPGDDFMTPEFQATLSDNLMTLSSNPIEYHDLLQIRHKDTKTYLHSHPDKYPLRYDDGRVSSQGQQVTGYPFNDTNNHWEILPAVPFEPGLEQGHPVLAGDIIRLRHVATDSILLTHDVASPLFPTNEEFTTCTVEDAYNTRANDTLFELQIQQAKGKSQFQTMSGHFKLIHVPTRVAMWTHTTPLPEWAFKQAEINGNKNIQSSTNIWYVDDIPSLPKDSPRLTKEEKKVKTVPFLVKWFELQRAMFYHNNALTSSHPYASHPIQWPFLLRGVSFWTHADTRQQIYFLGNPLGWWIASSLLAVFGGIVGADQLSLRRGIDALGKRTRSKLYNSTGFFFLMWAAHYLPFYLMGRQLFLHHYLPAHLASSLVAGALFEFIFCLDTQEVNEATVGQKKKSGHKRTLSVQENIATGQQNLLPLWASALAVITVLVGGWYFFLPLTYGYPGLDVPQIQARKWLGYDLHFAK